MFDKQMYGLEKNGSIKVWSITVDHADVGASLTICHGKEDGKLTTKVEVITEGKQGRTTYEQALLQANARIVKQTAKGYRENKNDLYRLPVIAMLAKDASNEKLDKAKLPFEQGVYISDKLDGVRCLAKCTYNDEIQQTVITIESRTGQLYDVPHIVYELHSIMEPGDIIDGELYFHGPVLQDINSAVTRTDPDEKIEEAYLKAGKARTKYGVESEQFIEANKKYQDALDIKALREQLEFRVFDIIQCSSVGVHNSSTIQFSNRLIGLGLYSDRFITGGKVFAVPYEVAHSKEELLALHSEAVARGFEGVMIRTVDGLYESGKRSAGLWKFKVFVDAEFQILDIIPDKEGNAVFVLRNNLNKLTFTCVMGTMEERKHYLENKHIYIGKWLTVQFQARFKGTKLPQFPTGKLFRECDQFGNPLE